MNIYLNRKKMLLASICIIFLVPFSAGASNYRSSENTKVVSFKNLDLSDAGARKLLRKRIENAARSICGSVEIRRAGSINQSRANRQCYDEALDKAMAKVRLGAGVDLHQS